MQINQSITEAGLMTSISLAVRDEQGTRKTRKGTLRNGCSFLQWLARDKQKLRPDAQDTLMPWSKKLPSQNMHWQKAELPELECMVLPDLL